MVADIALESGYAEIVFIDDGENDIPSYEIFKERYGRSVAVALGIGDNRKRKEMFMKLMDDGMDLCTLVHPSATISKSASIGTATVVMPGVVVNADAVVGCGVILNTNSVVEHDCRIGDFVHISPQAALGGGVEIGDLTHIGLSSCVIQSIRIGWKCIVGAGSTVVSDIEECTTSLGSPAKVIKRHECG